MSSQNKVQGTASPADGGLAAGLWAWGEVGRVRLVVLGLLLLAHLLFSLFAVNPGHFVSDEGIYHQMANAFANHGRLTLWPGFADFPSPELRTWNHVVAKDGSLQSQYPYLHPVLAYPFYKLAGFRGLFAMNAIAYLMLAGACFLLARRLWGNSKTAADSVILLTLATYAWQYSQAAWPQIPATAFMLTGILLSVAAAQEHESRKALYFAAAAGCVVGFGAGIRLDVFFIAPALFVPFLFDSPPRWRAAAAVLAGLLPGLLLLSLTNDAKFGTLQPLSYGRGSGATSFTTYLPLIAAAVAVLGIAWVASRETVLPFLARRWAVLLLCGIAIMAAAIFIVPAAGRLAHGIAVLVTDLSLIPPSVGGIAITRGPLGSVMYGGTVKKALLQSLPWLPIALFALAMSLRNRASVLEHAVPVLSVAAFLTVYGLFTWHGGYAFNLRYFVPLLPIFAIYGARGIHLLLSDDNSNRLRVAAAGTAAIAGIAWLTMVYGNIEDNGSEAIMLRLPLILAAILAILLFPLTFRRDLPKVRRIAFLAAFACIAWGFVAALLVDLPRSWILRQFRHETGVMLANHVPPNAVLFSTYDPASFVLTEIPGARNAWTIMDDFRDAPEILRRGLADKRPIYAYLNDEELVEFGARGMLKGLVADRIAKGRLAALYRLEPENSSSSGQAQ